MATMRMVSKPAPLPRRVTLPTQVARPAPVVAKAITVSPALSSAVLKPAPVPIAAAALPPPPAAPVAAVAPVFAPAQVLPTVAPFVPVATDSPTVAAARHHHWKKKKAEADAAAAAAQQAQQAGGASSGGGGSSSDQAQQPQETEYQREGDEEQGDRNQQWVREEQTPDQVEAIEQAQEAQEDGAEMAGDPTPPKPPEEPQALAGMRVALTIHDGKLCVLGACETQWGTVPIACQFGVEGDAGPNRAIDLNAPQTPEVINALTGAERKLGAMAKKETADMAVEDLVRRARLGDQNAMAMIAEVKRCAASGSQRPAIMLDKIQAYITANPYTGSTIGVDPVLPKSTVLASSVLANGPMLSKARLIEIAKSLGGNAKAFFFGCKNYMRPGKIAALAKKKPEVEGALKTGVTAGLARAIQIVRLPDSKIAHFAPSVAWELGE